jgi:hypothetical protein
MADKLIELVGDTLALGLTLFLAGGGVAVLACIYWIVTL